MTLTLRTTIATATIAATLGGCATGTRPAKVATAAPQPMPLMPVDPWARSVPSQAGTPTATAAPEAPPAPMSAAPEASPASVASSADARRTHTVAKGETLFAISAKYYGTGTKWPKIADANPGLKPERMPVGKQIVIP